MQAGGIQLVGTPYVPWPENTVVWVCNNNPFPTPPLRFDGNDYDFPPGEWVALNPETAFFLFSADTRTKPGEQIKVHRDVNAGRTPTNHLSHYYEALLRYGPDRQETRQWFANFDFEVMPAAKSMSKQDFDAMRKLKKAKIAA